MMLVAKLEIPLRVTLGIALGSYSVPLWRLSAILHMVRGILVMLALSYTLWERWKRWKRERRPEHGVYTVGKRLLIMHIYTRLHITRARYIEFM